jgi:hypothetical protein
MKLMFSIIVVKWHNFSFLTVETLRVDVTFCVDSNVIYRIKIIQSIGENERENYELKIL